MMERRASNGGVGLPATEMILSHGRRPAADAAILSFTVFFFQAEDGIRDRTVTGVQTCALPISLKCPQCGSTRFKANTRKPGPNDPVTCAQCGTVLDLAAEKKRLEEEARAAAEERLRDQS